VAVELPNRLLAKVQPQVQGQDDVADLESAFQVAEGVLVAWASGRGLVVVVEPGDGLDVAGVFVLLAKGVVDVEVQDLGQAFALGLLDGPGDLILAETVAEGVTLCAASLARRSIRARAITTPRVARQARSTPRNRLSKG